MSSSCDVTDYEIKRVGFIFGTSHKRNRQAGPLRFLFINLCLSYVICNFFLLLHMLIHFFSFEHNNFHDHRFFGDYLNSLAEDL